MMTKVDIKVESIIDNLDDAGLPEGDSEKNTSYFDGVLRLSGNEAHLSYKERTDGGSVQCEIFCLGDLVRVKRSGAIVSELIFREGESHSSVYSIPPFSFDAEVRAKKVRINLTEEGGKINLLYNMKIGGAEKAAIMRIWISKASNQA